MLSSILKKLSEVVRSIGLLHAPSVDTTLTSKNTKKIHLRLVRVSLNKDCTIGKLYLNDVFECYTLEDTVRTEKVYGKTAIPAGSYDLSISYSPRFKRPLPLLHGVPNFEGVRIHTGNTAKDTEGCILVGEQRGENHIEASRKAFQKLFQKLKTAQEATISIE